MPLKRRKPSLPWRFDNTGADQTFNLDVLDAYEDCMIWYNGAGTTPPKLIDANGLDLFDAQGRQYEAQDIRWKQFRGPFPKGTQLFNAAATGTTWIWPSRSISDLSQKVRKRTVIINETLGVGQFTSQWYDLSDMTDIVISMASGGVLFFGPNDAISFEGGSPAEAPSSGNSSAIVDMDGANVEAPSTGAWSLPGPWPGWLAMRAIAAGTNTLVSMTATKVIG